MEGGAQPVKLTVGGALVLSVVWEIATGACGVSPSHVPASLGYPLAPFLPLLFPFIYRIVIGNLFNINLYHPKKGEMVIDIILPEKRFKI